MEDNAEEMKCMIAATENKIAAVQDKIYEKEYEISELCKREFELSKELTEFRRRYGSVFKN